MNPELDFEKRYRLVREVIETIVLTALMFLVIRFAVQNFNIEGTSMEPSLHNQELILVDKWTYLFRPPARGDVIVFVAPPQPDQDYIKRVIALPGDTITIQNTTVIVDGVTLNETYVNPNNQGNQYDSKHISNLVIPPDDYFVLGDNRAGSSDSRAWGFVPKSNIIGRAALVYWPLQQDNDGFLPNVTSVFASVHQGGSALALLSDGFMIISSPVLPLAAPIVLLVFLRRRSWARARGRWFQHKSRDKGEECPAQGDASIPTPLHTAPAPTRQGEHGSVAPDLGWNRGRSPVDAHEPEDESPANIQDIQAD